MCCVAERDRQPREDAKERLKQEIERLRRELAERERQIAEQAKRIADLERQLALRLQNSTTTSKPPSSDGLAGCQRERGRRTKSRRKPGGQSGHPGHSRPLVANANAVVAPRVDEGLVGNLDIPGIRAHSCLPIVRMRLLIFAPRRVVIASAGCTRATPSGLLDAIKSRKCQPSRRTSPNIDAIGCAVARADARRQRRCRTSSRANSVRS